MRTYLPFIVAAVVLALASFALGSIAQESAGKAAPVMEKHLDEARASG